MAEEARLVVFPDGTRVVASPLSSRREDDPNRDFGLYCDPAWAPTWDAVVIDWPDFGIPTDAGASATAITNAFERAQAGEHLEVGCIGGLGRTGTVLACMAVLGGVPPDEAVSWIRAKYDPRAVETEEQAAWVIWFGDHVAASK